MGKNAATRPALPVARLSLASNFDTLEEKPTLHSESHPERLSNTSVLVDDDDDDDRQVVRELLEEDGFLVTEACNGRVALELMMAGEAPALVILDLEMPVMSGSELLDVMRGCVRLACVPVLVVSGKPLGQDGDRPVMGFLWKPCKANILIATARECTRPQ